MKKLAVAAAVALVMAGGVGSVFAQTVDQFESTFDFDATDVILFGNDVDDVTAGIRSNVIGEDSDGNNFQLNVTFDEFAVGANVMAIAANNAAINGSINLNGANITISAQDVEANATSKAEAATESTANATANAFSGSTFSTTAIGALLSATVEVDASMITNTASFTATDLKFTGEALTLDAGSEAASFNLGLGGISGMTAEPAEFAGNIATAESRVNSINASLIAVNLAPIDASVNLTAVYQPGNVFHSPTGGMVDVTNLNITTTAVGAINSGTLRLGSLLSSQ